METPEGSPAVLSKKTKKARWSEREEITLIDEVLEREEVLFGDLKGVAIKSVNRKRSDVWEEIADIISVRFSNAIRVGEEVKKKFFNLKQRSKEKIDDQRRVRQKTGGGPKLASMTAAEEALAVRWEGKPGMTGLTAGIDTDGIDILTTTEMVTPRRTSMVIPSTSTSSELKIMDNNRDVHQDSLSSCGEDVKNSSNQSKKRKHYQKDATYTNTVTDTKRMKKEIEKLNLEIKSIKQQTLTFSSLQTMADTVRVYYHEKLKQEFGLEIVTAEE